MTTTTKRRRRRGTKTIHPVLTEAYTYYVTSKSNNGKTGNIPTVWVAGKTGCHDKDKAITAGSCKQSGCPLLPISKGGDGVPTGRRACYAWSGQVSGALTAILKAKDKTKYRLKKALHNTHRRARYLRMSAIGDPSVLTRQQRDEIVDTLEAFNKENCALSTGFRIIGYIHGWRFAPWWKGYLLASTDSLEESDKAIEKGWRTAVTLPADTKGRVVKTPKGHKVYICPHLVAGVDKRTVKDCNDCGWCSVQDERFKNMHIGFPSHQ